MSESISYIRLECIANVIIMLYNFVLVSIITIGKNVYLYILTVVNLLLCILSDVFMVSSLPFSLNMGVMGIAITNILVYMVLFVIALQCLHKEGVEIYRREVL